MVKDEIILIMMKKSGVNGTPVFFRGRDFLLIKETIDEK